MLRRIIRKFTVEPQYIGILCYDLSYDILDLSKTVFVCCSTAQQLYLFTILLPRTVSYI